MIIYHRSNIDWDLPNQEMIERNSSGWGPGLGLYFSTSRDLYKKYGNILYSMEMRVPSNYKIITPEELRKSNPIQLKETLIGAGYNYLRVIERNGLCYMGVIINLDSVIVLSKEYEVYDEVGA